MTSEAAGLAEVRPDVETLPPPREPEVRQGSLLSGLLWTAANSWSVQLLNLGVFVLLARLLGPAAFGLVAMAGLFVQVSNILVDQGMGAALVQRRELEPEHADSAFWLGIGLGAALTALGILLSWPLAALFSAPALQPVVALLSLNFVIASFGGVQQALLSRNLAFKLLALRSFGAALVGSAVAVVMAVLDYGVMALVAQQLATTTAGVVLLWSVGRWTPGLRFSISHARALLGFGVNIVGLRLLNAVSRRSDDVLIGFFLGPVALGYYTIAYKIFKVLVEVVSKIVAKVALPAFARLQGEPEQLRRTFGQAVKISCLLAFPVFIGIGLVAGDLVPTLFGERWAPAVPVMRVLALMGMLQAIHLLVNQVLIATGKPQWVLRFLLVSTLLSVGSFLAVVRWGILAVAVAYTLVGYALFPVYLLMLKRRIGFGAASFVAQLRTPVLGSAAMAAGVLGARHLLTGHLAPALLLAATVASGSLLYALVVLRLERNVIGEWRRRTARRRTGGGVAATEAALGGTGT